MKSLKDKFADFSSVWLYRNGYSAVINADIKGHLTMKSKKKNFYYGDKLDHPITLSNGETFSIPTKGKFEVEVQGEK